MLAIDEIRKIIEYKNSTLLIRDRKSKEMINLLTSKIISDYEEGNYNFRNFKIMTLNQSGRKRHIKAYYDFTCEEILCIYIKRMLDRKLNVKYPNRNKFMHSLFDILNAVSQMNDFTIIRFDFEDFFNSISSSYVYEKYIKQLSLERHQKDLICYFANSTKYAYAGLNTSNLLAEIAAQHFDEVLKQHLIKSGLIYYRRYIDDGILIFNQFIDGPTFLNVIDKVINETFHDNTIQVAQKCKTKLNMSKFQHISKKDLLRIHPATKEFDFLGYLFVLKSIDSIKTEFKYGITNKKIDKYNKKMDDIINEYKIEHNVELLRHRVGAFTSRIVYRITKYKTEIWKVKGFISNYGELQYRLDRLTPGTEDFLKYMVINAFTRAGIAPPYFLGGSADESAYSLYNNLKRNRTLLFVELIGIGKGKLEKMCKQVGILVDGSKGYEGLVRDYLIRIKVGH